VEIEILFSCWRLGERQRSRGPAWVNAFDLDFGLIKGWQGFGWRRAGKDEVLLYSSTLHMVNLCIVARCGRDNLSSERPWVSSSKIKFTPMADVHC
jgi:hypothetical protein